MDRFEGVRLLDSVEILLVNVSIVASERRVDLSYFGQVQLGALVRLERRRTI